MSCTAPKEECNHWFAIDQDCTTLALPHQGFCDRHTDGNDRSWFAEHELADCCAECCDEAVHTIDGEPIDPHAQAA